MGKPGLPVGRYLHEGEPAVVSLPLRWLVLQPLAHVSFICIYMVSYVLHVTSDKLQSVDVETDRLRRLRCSVVVNSP